MKYSESFMGEILYFSRINLSRLFAFLNGESDMEHHTQSASK